MHLLSRFVAAAGAGLAVAVLAGCGGSSSLLSSNQANRLSGYLAKADTALSAHKCGAANRALNNFNDAVGELSGVNATLVSNLQQGVQTTVQLASSECPTGATTTPSVTTSSAPTTTTKPARTRPSTTTTKTSTHPQTITTATQTQTQPQSQTQTTQTEPSISTTTTTPASPTTTNSGGGGLTATGTPGAE